jgi:hypothetical protein
MGLDEYNGDSVDHTMLAKNFRSWAQGEDIKLCVSSRPHFEFHDVFSDSPGRRIQLHELTKLDIYIYGCHMIEQVMNAGSLQDKYLGLILEVVDRSEGVFLWAWLVVRMLMSGILRGDPIRTLVGNLATTPKELNDLYSRLLDSLQHHDRKKAAQMLILVAYNRHEHPFSSLAFFWLDHLEDVDFPSSNKISPFSQESLEAAIDTTDRQVRSVAKGFLESFPFPSPIGGWRKFPLGSAGLLGYRFFHRTARDFVLGNPKLEKIVDTKAICSAETAHRLRLAELMSLEFPLRSDLCIYIVYGDPRMRYLSKGLPSILLEKYHRAFQETARELSIPPKPTRFGILLYGTRFERHDLLGLSFPHLAVARDCGHYTMQLLKHDNRLLEGTEELSLLVTAALSHDIKLVESLLTIGAPVDSQILVTYGYSSPISFPVWMVILGYLTFRIARRYLDRKRAHFYFEMLETLLQHKSIPDCTITLAPPGGFPLSPQTYLLTLPEMVREMSPKNMDRILSLIEQRPGTWQAAVKQLRAAITRSPTKEAHGPGFDGRVHVKARDCRHDIRMKVNEAEVVCGEWRLSNGFSVGIY